MTKLTFVCATMGAGKSTQLFQDKFNFESKGFSTLVIIPSKDTRKGVGKIYSRAFDKSIKATAIHELESNWYEDFGRPYLVLVDEAQFLSEKSVKNLAKAVDYYKINVIAYGLKVDSDGNLFPGSKALLELSDEIKQLHGVCNCGEPTNMVLRMDKQDRVLKNQEQIHIEGSDDNIRYVPVCRKCFLSAYDKEGR